MYDHRTFNGLKTLYFNCVLPHSIGGFKKADDFLKQILTYKLVISTDQLG